MKELYDFLAEIDALDELAQADLENVINKTSDLKQLPLIARKIMSVIENPKSTAGDLERVVQSDQALTVKLLKIANSSFYGLLRKVNTLQRAILVIGFKAIKDIAVSTAILNMYRSSDPLSIKFWEHAVGVGIAARLLSLEFDSTETDEAFVAGLLHNLGKALILRTDPIKAKDIFEAAHSCTYQEEMDKEREAFGFCHTHAGGQLARNWNLAPSLEAVMRYHHNLPEVLWTEMDMSIKTNIAIVSYADRFMRRLGIGFNSPDANHDLFACPEAEFLKIPEARINELIEEINLAFYQESQMFA